MKKIEEFLANNNISYWSDSKINLALIGQNKLMMLFMIENKKI